MKQFDVTVLGSTGFTGRLVCKHIVQKYHGKGSFTWAMAGRSKTKLQEIRTWLAEEGQNLDDVKMFEADVNDQASLNALAAASSVVITAVGPYALYGRPVVQACVENKSHYCDITGEPNFILKTSEEFDSAAKANGARIVHSCGFDSVPSEVMTLQAAHHMSTKHNMLLGEVTGYMMDASVVGIGGGTIDSGVNLMKETAIRQDPQAKKAMSHPYSLIPNFDDKAELSKLPDKGASAWPAYSHAAQAWGAPFVMAACNERVVRMSNALLGWKLGKQMVYSERCGKKFSAALMMSMLNVVLSVTLYLAARFEWIRRKLPAPGDGPENALDDNFFVFSCWALPDTSNGVSGGSQETPVRVKSKFADMKRSGGYWSTSRMLLECALCMIPENEKLLAQDPYASSCPAGVLAPSAAFGLVLHDRLKNAEFTIEVEDVPVDGKKAA